MFLNNWELGLRNAISEASDLAMVDCNLGRITRIRKTLHLYVIEASETAEILVRHVEKIVMAEEPDEVIGK